MYLVFSLYIDLILVHVHIVIPHVYMYLFMTKGNGRLPIYRVVL